MPFDLTYSLDFNNSRQKNISIPLGNNTNFEKYYS